QRAGLVVARLGRLVLELVAGSARSVALLGVAALYDEVRDDPVERYAVVEVVAGQHHEVVDGDRRRLGVELHGEGAGVGLDLGRVGLGRVDALLGRAVELCLPLLGPGRAGRRAGLAAEGDAGERIGVLLGRRFVPRLADDEGDAGDDGDE